MPCTQTASFNHYWHEQFLDMYKAITPNNNNSFEPIANKYGGLCILNTTGQGGYISADINQAFDFITNYEIYGSFNVFPVDKGTPCGLDIVVCNERNCEILSVILGEGQLNGFAIKFMGETLKDKDVKTNSNDRCISLDNNCMVNYFKISITDDCNGILCRIFLDQQNSLGPKSKVHERFFPQGFPSRRMTRIKIKMWQAGYIELYDLNLSEIR